MVSDDGRIKEIDFIECVRSMAQIFYTREKKEKRYQYMIEVTSAGVRVKGYWP